MAYALKSDAKHPDHNGVRKFKFKGMYRDSSGRLLSVKDADDKVVWYWSKGAAQSAANEAEVKARRAAPTVATTSGDITYGEWFERTSDGNRHPFTDDDYAELGIMNNFVLPKWGDKRLASITTKAVKDWIRDDLIPGRSASYANKIYYAFKVWINLAVESEVLTATPCTAKMGLPRVYAKSQSYFEPSDIELYRELGFREDYLRVVEFAVETGMRPGEQAGLHEKSVEASRGWVRVADVLVFGKMSIRSHPKDKEPRLVPLTHRAVEIIKEAIGDRDLMSGCGLPHFDGSECASELIFRTKLGKVIKARNVSTALRTFQEQHNLPRKSSYSARRAFVTWALEYGLDPATVQKIVGHAKFGQTLDYFQVGPAARNRLEEVRASANRPSATVSGTVAKSVAERSGRMQEDVASDRDQHAA